MGCIASKENSVSFENKEKIPFEELLIASTECRKTATDAISISEGSHNHNVLRRVKAVEYSIKRQKRMEAAFLKIFAEFEVDPVSFERDVMHALRLMKHSTQALRDAVIRLESFVGLSPAAAQQQKIPPTSQLH